MLPIGAAAPAGGAARAVGSGAGGKADRWGGLPPFEDLNHRRPRRAVQAAQLAGDLDAVDLVKRNVLQGGCPERGGTDPHAVHQDERMAAVRAAHENAARLAEAPVTRDLDAAQRLEHFDQRLLAGFGNILGGDDRDRLQRLR
jgi:hypothetical protein